MHIYISPSSHAFPSLPHLCGHAPHGLFQPPEELPVAERQHLLEPDIEARDW